MCGSQGRFALYAAVEETRITDRIANSLPSNLPRTFPIPLFSGIATTADSSLMIDLSNPPVAIALRDRNGSFGLFTLTLEELGFHKGG